MIENCPHSCFKWQQDMKRIRVAYISEDKPSFFELSAKNSTGSTLDFRRFEGYITLVITVARTCKDWKKIDGIYRGIEYLHHTWPFILEILVFFYDHPDLDYEIDCASFHARWKFTGRKIHIMEVVPVNGPDAHPVIKYLKWTMTLNEESGIPTDFTSFFLINPDGNTIQYLKAMSFDKLKVRIQNTINSEYSESDEEEEDGNNYENPMKVQSSEL